MLHANNFKVALWSVCVAEIIFITEWSEPPTIISRLPSYHGAIKVASLETAK